jgi:hypothetical protein
MDLHRAFRWLLRAIPGAEKRAYRAEEAAYAAWRLRNPGGRRADFYTEIVSQGMQKQGASHPTLGAALQGGVPFDESGRHELDRLTGAGLRPEHVCVDYGCGSLRIGQHVIRYLNPSCYWGLDATDRFYRIGLDLIGADLVREKQPHVHVIDTAVLDQVRAARPHFVYSNAVVLHVPPEEIREFFANVMGLFDAGTRGLINVRLSSTAKRISSRSWAYSESELTRLVEEFGGTVITIDKAAPQRSKHSLRRDVYPAWMTITSAAAKA